MFDSINQVNVQNGDRSVVVLVQQTKYWFEGFLFLVLVKLLSMGWRDNKFCYNAFWRGCIARFAGWWVVFNFGKTCGWIGDCWFCVGILFETLYLYMVLWKRVIFWLWYWRHHTLVFGISNFHRWFLIRI